MKRLKRTLQNRLTQTMASQSHSHSKYPRAFRHLIVLISGAYFIFWISHYQEDASKTEPIVIAEDQLPTGQQVDSTVKYLPSKHVPMPSTLIEEKQKKALNALREDIAKEVEGYDFSEHVMDNPNLHEAKNISLGLDSLIMEKGGIPVRNVLFASWRSGSTFIGRLLDFHPGMYFQYEPLIHFGVVQANSEKDAEDALGTLKGIFACNYTSIPRLSKFMSRFHQGSSIKENRVVDRCLNRWLDFPTLCRDPAFISHMCKLFPFQTVKTVRMRLRLGKILLEDPRLNIRLLLLIRDPRAIMLSRQRASIRLWCDTSIDCRDVRHLCADMEEDFLYAEQLKTQFSNRFLAMRYEDIALNPFPAARKIFKFFHLQFHPQVHRFLRDHTRKLEDKVEKAHDVHRNSEEVALRWMREFHKGNFSQLLEIQKSCETAMKVWGYAQVKNKSQLKSSHFTPLLSPPMPEMVVLDE